MKILFSLIFIFVCFVAGFSQDSRVMAEVLRTSERIIKNAPFSADATSSSVQIFADGNRITRSSTSRLFRDSEGRYRREDMAKQLGVPGAVIELPESILILDPVSGSKYTLNTKRNSARQTPFRAGIEFRFPVQTVFKVIPEFKQFGEKTMETARPDRPTEYPSDKGVKSEPPQPKPSSPPLAPEHPLFKSSTSDSPPPRVIASEDQRPKRTTRTETLGMRRMEGVEVEGTRTITTIPAGLIGNERDIEVVYERWFSKDLQLIVFSKNVDPAFGEQTYRLTNIRREDPPIVLFAPPADYTIVSDQPNKPPPPVIKAPSSEKKPVAPSKQVPTAIRKMTFG